MMMMMIEPTLMTLDPLASYFRCRGMDAVEALVELDNDSRLSRDHLNLVIELARLKPIEASKTCEKRSQIVSLLD